MLTDIELKWVTVETYNTSAKELSKYFKQYSRLKHIEMTMELAGWPKNPKVLEVGCGDGRDAETITKFTDDYVGFDISGGLIAIARGSLPNLKFEVGDAVSYEYPKNIDMIFAFASLLHVDKNEISVIFTEINKSLKVQGLIYLSFKYAPEYQKELKEDQYGTRLFYLYNSELIKSIAGSNFEMVYLDENVSHGSSKNMWTEMILRKIK